MIELDNTMLLFIDSENYCSKKIPDRKIYTSSTLVRGTKFVEIK